MRWVENRLLTRYEGHRLARIDVPESWHVAKCESTATTNDPLALALLLRTYRKLQYLYSCRKAGGR